MVFLVSLGFNIKRQHVEQLFHKVVERNTLLQAINGYVPNIKAHGLLF